MKYQTSGPQPKAEKKAPRRGLRVFFLSILCLGVIFVGLAAYLQLTGGGIRPPDQSGGLEPIDTGLLEDGAAAVLPSRAPGEDTAGDRREGVYTIILAGTDMDDYHTDSLMVAALDTKNGTLKILSIPRDTQVAVKRETKKINAAWGVGKIDQLRAELKTVLGFVPDAYAVVDLKGFVKLVDAIDGVDFDVPQNMYYNDPAQNLYINLKKGPQHLDGAKAIQLVRFRRYTEGDIKRVQVQQQFLTAVFKQTIRLKNVFKVNEFAQIASDHLRSDLSVGQMAWFGLELMKLDEGAISFHTLPGDASAYYKGQNYVLVDQTEALKLINETINPFTTPITADHINISQLRDN
ncbi:MAG: LCP family protein [Oscillospiraceae bacterium]|jgi:LCP family protein required for cell wall assembly|nr:LCP family protein [Oscillospiraceae bacterium]